METERGTAGKETLQVFLAPRDAWFLPSCWEGNYRVSQKGEAIKGPRPSCSCQHPSLLPIPVQMS